MFTDCQTCSMKLVPNDTLIQIVDAYGQMTRLRSLVIKRDEQKWKVNILRWCEFICESAEKKNCVWACCFILTLVSCWNDCAHIWMQALLWPRGFRSFCCKMVTFELFSVTGFFRNHSNILFWCSKIIFGAYESQCWKTVVLLFLWKPLSFFQDNFFKILKNSNIWNQSLLL